MPASICMVLRLTAFKKQAIWLFYPLLTLEKEIKWWSLLSALLKFIAPMQDLNHFQEQA